MRITFTLFLPRDEATVPVVRHVCRGALVRLGVAAGCVGDIELAVTEACTNVLQHAVGPDAEYEVTIEVNERNCEIRVIDTGSGFDHTVRAPAQLEAESGRGIVLMSALVDDLEFVSEPEAGTAVHLVKRLEFTDDSDLRRLSRADRSTAATG